MRIETVLEFAPDDKYIRHSEGDFARLPDGGLLFAYSRFTEDADDDGPSDIVGVTSYDEGLSWSEPRVLIAAARHGVRNVMSVSLLPLKSGETGLFYLIKQSPVENLVMFARSRDGYNYGDAQLCSSPARRGLYIINNQRAERMSDGAIVLPVALHYASLAPDGRRLFNGYGECYCLRSDDDGATFYELRGQAHASFNRSRCGLQEPGLIELKSGAWWMYARTDMMYQYECFSHDGGETWSVPQPSVFTSPQSPMKLIRDPYTDRICAVWNPIPNYNGREIVPCCGGRTPLVMAFSSDEGKSWTPHITLDDAPDAGYCYPAVYFTPDGGILVAYCAGSEADGSCLVRLRMKKLMSR